MKLNTALTLLNNCSNTDLQLFFGDLRIYDNEKLIISSGIGSFLRSPELLDLKNRTVNYVLWNCHNHMWCFYLK